MLFDAQAQAVEMTITPGDEHVELAITLAFSIPAGPNQFGILRFPMARDAAIENGTALLEAGENLPEKKKKSDIIVPSNLGDVERAAQQDQKLRGKS